MRIVTGQMLSVTKAKEPGGFIPVEEKKSILTNPGPVALLLK